LQEIKEYSNLPTTPLDKRYNAFMDAGNKLCKKTHRGDTLAVLSVGAIKRNSTKVRKPTPRCAYVFSSLKRPEEVETLRAIYGPSFFLIAVYSSRKNRLEKLSEDIARSYGSSDPQKFQDKAVKLLTRDEKEQFQEYGQNVRDTFPLADLFVNVGDSINLKAEIKRYIEIVFGYPYHTPSRDEYAMFHAYAAALRSSSLSRQVGAAISNAEGDIISVGTNEVPKAGGGSYWPGDVPDKRDHNIGYEMSDKMKENIFREILNNLQTKKWFNNSISSKNLDELTESAMNIMKTTQVMNLIEFGRAEHAELSAFLDAARRGISVKDCSLFTTTYPCHNCARHIITAGISRVIYIEPYPKSKALKLHSDAITENIEEEVCNKVLFEPFIGISPQKYTELFLFSKDDRINKDDKIIKWERDKTYTNPRFVKLQPFYKYYLVQENDELTDLYNRLKEYNIELNS